MVYLRGLTTQGDGLSRKGSGHPWLFCTHIAMPRWQRHKHCRVYHYYYYYRQCSRIRILRFFQISKRHDFLRFL